MSVCLFKAGLLLFNSFSQTLYNMFIVVEAFALNGFTRFAIEKVKFRVNKKLVNSDLKRKSSYLGLDLRNSKKRNTNKRNSCDNVDNISRQFNSPNSVSECFLNNDTSHSDDLHFPEYTKFL